MITKDLHKTIVESIIKPCPTPKDLGFSCTEYRIEKYKKLLHYIYDKHENTISLSTITIMFIIWLEGLHLGNIIFDEGFFCIWILGPSLAILWSYFLFQLCDYLTYKFSKKYAKWKFNRLNQKGLLEDDIQKYIPYFSIEKFSNDELSQIEQYIAFKERYDFIVYKAEQIIKQNLKDKQ